MDLIEVIVTAADEVSGDEDEVGGGLIDERYPSFNEGFLSERADVQVGDVHDAEAVEAGREVFDWEIEVSSEGPIFSD